MTSSDPLVYSSWNLQNQVSPREIGTRRV